MFLKNTAQSLYFMLISATDGSVVTGADVAAYVSKDQENQVEAAGSVVELGNGQYRFDGTAADWAGDELGFAFKTVGAIAVSLSVSTKIDESLSTWYVSKQGNDGNGGHSWADSLLTITQAVTNAASGDKIIIGAGTYTGDVNASAKELTFISAVRRAAIVQGDTDKALWLDDNSTVIGLQIISADLAMAQGIYCASKSNVRIIDCYVW